MLSFFVSLMSGMSSSKGRATLGFYVVYTEYTQSFSDVVVKVQQFSTH